MKTEIKPLLRKSLPHTTLYYSFSECPFARILLASTSEGLCSVSLVMGSDGEAVEHLKRMFPGAEWIASVQPDHELFNQVFSKEPVNLRFHLMGTPFQLDVWKALLNIPMGDTTTYGALAAQIGRPKAFRAVGSAVGDNPIFFAIPCHRVLPASGGVGNYFWGPEIKKRILTWEGAI